MLFTLERLYVPKVGSFIFCITNHHRLQTMYVACISLSVFLLSLSVNVTMKSNSRHKHLPQCHSWTETMHQLTYYESTYIWLSRRYQKAKCQYVARRHFQIYIYIILKVSCLIIKILWHDIWSHRNI